MTGALEGVVFGYRRTILLAFIVLTVLLGFSASRLQIDAGFEKGLPLSHPYMQTFRDHQAAFGGANRLLIAVRARNGDIFQPHVLETLKQVTDAVFFLPGVNRSSVRSIFTPNVRFVEVVADGFAGGNVVPAGFEPTPGGIAQVRENILKAGIIGRLVANDFSAALVSAELIPRAPAGGDPIGYFAVADALEKTIRDRFTDDQIDIHILGFAQAVHDIANGAREVVAFFAIALVVTATIVWLFLRSLPLTLLPLACSLVAVVWTLGLLPLLGYGLDPLSILVPFLVFAIGVSHGVQMASAVAGSAAHGADCTGAARAAFRRLLVPGGLALLSDAVGFLTILLIDIGIIRELAITASLGVLVIILTNLLLLPILLSWLPARRAPPDRRIHLDWLWRRVADVTGPRAALAALGGALLLLGAGLLEARHLEIGDLQPGIPELRADARYNQDSRFITEHFSIGVDVIQVIAESHANACVEHDVMAAIDRFQWHMQNVPGVQSTLSLPQVAKNAAAGWNEGSLKWHALPRNPPSMVQATAPVETSTGLLNADCSVMPVLIFIRDHRAETIERVVDAVEAFQAANPSEDLRLRLATGNVGIMAATNQVVAAARLPILLWIYAAIVLLCVATFRSIRATVCIVGPLGLISVLVYALMSLMGIGLKVATLPVAALGVGIGVDYGIYLFARLDGLMREGRAFAEAWYLTLRSTGNAVLLTGLTLSAGVLTWVFSDLQFQADMGLLLAFMFLGNMAGALILLPALASLAYRERHRRST